MNEKTKQVLREKIGHALLTLEGERLIQVWNEHCIMFDHPDDMIQPISRLDSLFGAMFLTDAIGMLRKLPTEWDDIFWLDTRSGKCIVRFGSKLDLRHTPIDIRKMTETAIDRNDSLGVLAVGDLLDEYLSVPV